ncbi:MAG: HAMP domain-containing sensor histidine kinase [Polyangiaceae bacterium]
MKERRLGERLLYFLLIPAIVIAAFALGALALRISPGIERARQQTVLDATAALATERATMLDDHIIRQDNVVTTYTNVNDLGNFGRRWLATASRETPSVRAILVVDMSHESHEVLAFVSRSPSREDDTFRRLLINRLFRTLNLEGQVEELRHLHEAVGERQYLLSYWQRSVDGRRLMVVLWHDVDRLIRDVMTQLFKDPDRGDTRMNVVDERGRIVFGPPLKVGRLTVGVRFPTTLYNWQVQVALTTAEEVDRQVERRRLIEFLLVVVAGLITTAGLIIVINASLKERRVSAMKSEFVANVSHELKTPLSLIRMFGELLLLDRATTEAKRKHYLQIIVGESERLTTLIENVLDFARVERGKAAYDLVEGSVEDVARRAVESFRYRAESEAVILALDIQDDIPRARIDQRALELAILNLIDNALKYAKEGGRVTVKVERDGRRVAIKVMDEGPGIPKEEHARIFERFYRGAAANSTRARGSGIGLALVRHIAENHGGRVRVFSPTRPDGGGTSFVIDVPAVPTKATPNVASRTSAAAGETPIEGAVSEAPRRPRTSRRPPPPASETPSSTAREG